MKLLSALFLPLLLTALFATTRGAEPHASFAIASTPFVSIHVVMKSTPACFILPTSTLKSGVPNERLSV